MSVVEESDHPYSVFLRRTGERGRSCFRQIFQKHRDVRVFEQNVKSSSAPVNDAIGEFLCSFPSTRL